MLFEREYSDIYYEVRGEGEPLLLVHGIIVDAGLYERGAEILASKYRVITFDRCGNSRSKWKGEPSFSIEAQAEDIRELLDHLGIESTYIFGASAGAVITSAFVQKYPERVKHAILYEPAMIGYMRGDARIEAWVDEMLGLIGKKKYLNAILRFAENIASKDERSPKKSREASLREMYNWEYSLTCEFPKIICYKPDLERLKESIDKITFAAGEKSGDTMYAIAPRILAEQLGGTLVYYPGYHNLPYDLPREFAICVIGTLGLK